MVHRRFRAVVVGALITIGCLGAAYAAPIAPTAMTALTSSPVESVSFWGRSFPSGSAYYPGQCYATVQEETPTGYVLRRVWICTEPRREGYGYEGWTSDYPERCIANVQVHVPTGYAWRQVWICNETLARGYGFRRNPGYGGRF